MKWKALKAKQDCEFWSSTRRCKGFSKTNDSVKYSIQNWIIYHPHVIKYPISNDYITVNCYDGIRGLKTEIRQKVILQVSVRELHIEMLKICY